jgi:hypothetical protein
MCKEQGPITLTISEKWRSPEAIEAILQLADKQVGEPPPRTLKLVEYRKGAPVANIAMICYTPLGSREQYVEAFRGISGVIDAN